MAKRSCEGREDPTLRIYFAGKVDNYREGILGPRIMSEEEPIVIDQTLGKFIYVGPNAISCDHGCFHRDESTHGMLPSKHGCEAGFIGNENYKDLKPRYVVERCLAQIISADLFYAWINSHDCFGTLAEIGFASAHGVPIILEIKETFVEDLWFITKLPFVQVFYSDHPMGEEASKLIKERTTNSLQEKLLVISGKKTIQ